MTKKQIHICLKMRYTGFMFISTLLKVVMENGRNSELMLVGIDSVSYSMFENFYLNL